MIATTTQFDPLCVSSQLAFRYVVDESAEWLPGVSPLRPANRVPAQIGVRDAPQLLKALRRLVAETIEEFECGLLLSSGVDSAILAALLPRGSRVYTVRFAALGALDESVRAAQYAQRNGLHHRVITVTWTDYEQHADFLMQHKRSPLHPVEVGLFLAAQVARDDGLDTLLVGNGADTTFGGLDQLLSRDWTLDEFIKRYSFLAPESVLEQPVSVREVFAAYDTPHGFNVADFLKEIHGAGVAQAFNNAITAAGCASVEPYESLQLDAPLDLALIRRGESKYLLREVFQHLYPNLPVPTKIAFARPMDSWLKAWRGPSRREFIEGCEIGCFSGEQKWLLYNLERFMDLFGTE